MLHTAGFNKLRLAGILTSFILIFGKGLAVEQNVWDNSINHQTKERYIPVELWTGIQWDGNKELKMLKVDSTLGIGLDTRSKDRSSGTIP